MAQNPMSDRDWAVVIPVLPFSRNDQNKAQTTGLRIKDKTDQCGMRTVKSHTVKIQPRFGRQLPSLQIFERLLVHPNWCVGDGLFDGTCQVMGCLGF